MATENNKQLTEALKILYRRLKKSPEKGENNKSYVAWSPPVGILGQAGYKTGEYVPNQATFIAAENLIFDPLEQTPEQFIASRQKYYGIYGAEATYEEIKGERPPDRWFLQTKTFLSKDEKYYIVPVVYEKIAQNESLKHFFTNPNDPLDKGSKLKIYGAGSILGPGPKSKVFLNSAKIWALEKLAVDLGKSISQDNKREAEKAAFLPVDSHGADGTGAEMAEAWYVDARPKKYQNLFLKVMFDRNWVESLPPRLETCTSDASRTVMLFVKDLERDLRDLEQILYEFNDRILNSRVQVDFDATCAAGKIPKIPEILNSILKLNNKPALSDKSIAALQIGFTETLDLQYIAYSEEPDCLCDKNNISAYFLQKGIEDLKSTPPFDSRTNNGFLFYLPEIIRKYASYLHGEKNKYLFAAQESWLRFVQNFVYPEPEIVFDENQTEEAIWLERMESIKKGTRSVLNMTRDAFLLDPTMVMSPDLRKTVLGATKTESAYIGDDIMMNAIKAEVFNVQSLYKRLLHKVPVMELVKLAATALYKCTAEEKLKKELCKAILKSMPRVEVETRLIPCLRQAGPEGQLAVASLGGAISSRQNSIYAQARARFPEKFPASAAAKTEGQMAAVNDLYCNDPALQKSLGRAPDDMSEELLAWLENTSGNVICDCIMSIYSPVQQILDFVEEAYDGVVDIVDTVGQNRARSLENTTTVSFKTLVKPCEKTTDRVQSFGDEMLAAFWKLITVLVFAAVFVLLNNVKKSVLGGLLRDVCNAAKSPWDLLDPTDMIMSSPLWVDKGYLELKAKYEKLKTISGLNGDIQNLIEAIKELGKGFSPSEMKRLFTTDCGDNSFDVGFAKAAKIFEDNGIVSDACIEGPTPTTPTDAAVLAEEKMNAADLGDANHDPLDIPPLCPAPACGPGAVKDFLSGVGGQIDPTLWDDAIEKWDEANAKIADLCDPKTVSTLADSLDADSIIKLAEKDQDTLIKDITDILPLLDANKLEEMMPPLFCGPCSPRKVGQKPLMSSQTHPTQLYLLEQFNNNLFKTTGQLFNVDINAYKTIMLGTGDKFGTYLEVYNEVKGKHMPSELELEAMVENKQLDAIAEANRKIQAEVVKLLSEKDKGEEEFVAKGLLSALETTTGTNQTIVTNEPEYRLFIYDIPASSNEILLAFNFSGNTITTKGIKTEALQIKIVVRNKLNKVIEYEWPDPEDSEVHHLKDFNENDLSIGFFKNLGEKIPAMNTLVAANAFAALLGAESTSLTQHYPLIINLIFETILTQSTHHDLFKSAVFDKIPLTDQEVKKSCQEGSGATPLFDVEKITNDVSKAREALECVVSMFATPDAPQIALMYGIYKSIAKVCIVEEYLKNIFAFGFVRISDITESDMYMPLLTNNIINAVQTSIGADGYNNLLDYSSKIINGRQQLGEEFESLPMVQVPGGLGPIEEVRPSEECLGILIKEAAREVNDVLDDRIQSIADPKWIKKFYTYAEVDEPQPQEVLESRLLNYATLSSPEYWSPNLFPVSQGGTLDNLSAMRYIGQGSTDTPYAWPTTPVNNLLEKHSAWPSRGKNTINEDLPWEGGLFFQPYIRLKSKLEVEDENEPAEEARLETALNKFWTKFKEENARKRVLENFNWPKSPDPDHFAHNAINAMIDKVDAERHPGSGGEIFVPPVLLKDCPTFKAFWNILFNPHANASHWKSTKPFTALVSSHYLNKNPAIQEEYDAYYYWQKKDHGTTAANEKYHWLNRGTTSPDFAIDMAQEAEAIARNTAAIADAQHIIDWRNPTKNPLVYLEGNLIGGYTFPVPPRHGAPYHPPRLNSLGQLNSSPTKIIPNDMFSSNVDIFALAKEIKIGAMSYTENENIFLGSLRNFLHTDLGVIATTEDQEGHYTEGEHSVYMPKKYWYGDAAAFWYRVRDIILDSPYDTWFDFTLGMRLNLLFPIDENAESNVFSVAQAAMDSEDFSKYNKEKMFVWEKSPGDRYLCLPLESVEHDYAPTEDITDFWVDINNHIEQMSFETNPAAMAENDSNLGLVYSNVVGGAPTLWAFSRAISTELYHNKDKIFDSLKRDLQEKILGVGQYDGQESNKFLNEILPIKELVVITVLMYRYYMESAYPELNTLFSSTKDSLNKQAQAMAATIEGDYQYIEGAAANEPEEPPGFSNEQILKQFLALTVQMAANMTDPSWTTPWFLPGPITPFGVVAKLLATKWDEDDDKTTIEAEEACPPLPTWWGGDEDLAEVLEGAEGETEPTLQQLGVDPETIQEWLKQMAADEQPPTYDGFIFPPYVHGQPHEFEGKLPFVGGPESTETPYYVPYDRLTAEGKARQWQYFQASYLGFPTPPPFYTKYNAIAYACAAQEQFGWTQLPSKYFSQGNGYSNHDKEKLFEMEPMSWLEVCAFKTLGTEGVMSHRGGFNVTLPFCPLPNPGRNNNYRFSQHGLDGHSYRKIVESAVTAADTWNTWNQAWYYYLYGFAGSGDPRYGKVGCDWEVSISWLYPALFAQNEDRPGWHPTMDYTDTNAPWVNGETSKVVEYYMIDPDLVANWPES